MQCYVGKLIRFQRAANWYQIFGNQIFQLATCLRLDWKRNISVIFLQLIVRCLANCAIYEILFYRIKEIMMQLKLPISKAFLITEMSVNIGHICFYKPTVSKFIVWMPRPNWTFKSSWKHVRMRPIPYIGLLHCREYRNFT